MAAAGRPEGAPSESFGAAAAAPAEPKAPGSSATEGDEPGSVTIPSRHTTVWIAMLLIVASAAMVMFHIQPTSKRNVNTASRFATADSLVHRGTYAINGSRYKFTVDKVKLGENYYSSKPPVIPTYTAGAYYVYNKVTGHTFRKNERQSVFWCTMATGWLSHVVTLAYLFLFARRLFKRDVAVLAVVATAAFAYLGVGFATRLNNHTIAAAAAVMGYYHAFRAGEDGNRARHFLLSGLSLGFLPTFDIPSAIISFGGFVYLLTKNWKRTLYLFVPAALPGLALHLYLMESIYGSILPVQVRKDATSFAGSYSHRRAGIDALKEPKHVYLFHMLFGHHGLFSMTPIFALSLVGFFRDIRQRGERRGLAVTVLAVLVSMVALYTYMTRNYGGWSVGFRWLIPIMPALILFFGAWLERAKLRTWKLALCAAAFAVASFHTQDAVSGPFQFSRWHNYLDNAPGRNRTDVHTSKEARAKAKRRKAEKASKAKARRAKARRAKARRAKARREKARREKARRAAEAPRKAQQQPSDQEQDTQAAERNDPKDPPAESPK